MSAVRRSSNPNRKQRHDLDALEQEMHELVSTGVTWVCIYLPATDLTSDLREIERFGERVILQSSARGD
jgi:hypothetical protein